MVTGQVVMVMIMTATPLHLRHHGSDLGIVGLVMSAHTLGMYALSPITGRLVDRFGGTGVALGGVGLLGLSAVAAASAPNQSTALLLVTLFTLGFGWNLAFVSGSSLLTGGMGTELRARLQGRVDSIAWGSGAVASITSGVVYQATDYRVTSLIGLLLLVAPAVIIGRRRRLAVPAEA
jgi:MFS family permease